LNQERKKKKKWKSEREKKNPTSNKSERILLRKTIFFIIREYEKRWKGEQKWKIIIHGFKFVEPKQSCCVLSRGSQKYERYFFGWSFCRNVSPMVPSRWTPREIMMPEGLLNEDFPLKLRIWWMTMGHKENYCSIDFCLCPRHNGEIEGWLQVSKEKMRGG
jgi:hypothetical protein